jgi:D-galacturonate reductase
MESKPACLAVGIGEYVTGYVHGAASQSDKKIGVVGLVLFDLRRRGKVGRILMAGTSGSKFPGIRQHFEQVRFPSSFATASQKMRFCKR